MNRVTKRALFAAANLVVAQFAQEDFLIDRRRTVIEVAKEYPDIELEHVLVDAATIVVFLDVPLARSLPR